MTAGLSRTEVDTTEAMRAELAAAKVASCELVASLNLLLATAARLRAVLHED